MRRLSTFLLALLTAAALLAPPAVAQDDPQGGDNAAVAVNTHDGSTVFRIAFGVQRVVANTVDNTNIAFAYASCEDCRTIAIAIQVVLADVDATSASPENVAIAINEECTSCETAALAYQLVFIGSSLPDQLPPELLRAFADTHRRLQQLRAAADEMTLEEIEAEVDAIVDDLATALDEALAPPDPAMASTTTTTATTTTTDGTSVETTTTVVTSTSDTTATTAETTSTTGGP